jgi:N-acylglucosamine-6-phosphate 2-epimerase
MTVFFIDGAYVISPRLLALQGSLLVSVQADDGSPMLALEHIVAMAESALLGGASGLRLKGAAHVAAMRARTEKPIIGLTKSDQLGSDVYITPRSAEAVELARAGATLVAIDATARSRPEPFYQIAAAVHDAGALVLADISTLAEARTAIGEGADIVATTLSGYTPDSPHITEPDFALMKALNQAGIPFIAEGRIQTTQHAVEALKAGAFCVVVGSAITRPDVITSWYASALKEARQTA